jgi:predicted permease
MGRLRRAVGGLLALVRSRRTERELDEEVRAYLEASIQEKMRAGMAREDAARAARLQIGSVALVKDSVRDVGWETRLENLWRDVRYAARTLRRSPAFTAVAVATLALGIGVNTTIFSAINAIMLRALPVDHPDQLVSLAVVFPSDVERLFSYSAYRTLTAGAAPLVDAAAASNVLRDGIALDGLPEPIDYKWVSGNYFSVLRVSAAAGRTLLPADDRLPRGEAVAVLSDAYWSRRFGRDPTVIGRAFRFKAADFTIVGVAARGFSGENPGEGVDLWMPVSAHRDAPSWLWHGHSTTWLNILGRRRPGVTVDAVRAHLDPLYRAIRDEIVAETTSPTYRALLRDSRLVVSEASGGTSRLRNNLATPLLILMALVGLVLVVACANTASLMLARAAARRREVAVSLAIGAGRLRLVRQAIMEAMLLSAAGGGAGLLLAEWGASALKSFVSGAFPISLDVSPDLAVMGFALLVSSATAVVVGLVPALRAARTDPLGALKSGLSRQGMPHVALGRMLVAAQMVVSMVLLIVASLFVRSLRNVERIETGFDPDRLLLFRMTPAVDEQPIPAETRRNLYRQLVARARSVAGVEGASASRAGMLSQDTWSNTIFVEGFVPKPGATPRTFVNAVTSSYFEVMRIPLRRGRAFTDADDETAPKVAIANDAFARRFFGESEAIGKRVALCSSDPCGATPKALMTIIGVAEDAKYVDLRENKRSMLYVSVAQMDQNLGELQVRTAVDPGSLIAPVYEALARVDRRVPIVAVTRARDRVDASMMIDRLVAVLSVGLGALALILAAVGLYGLTAYLTAQRTGEIGVRMALGAGSSQIQGLVLRDAVRLVVVGVGIGVPAALAGTRLLASQLYEVRPDDPLALLLALAALSAAVFIAGYLPARRAARLDPVVALRAE